MVTAEEDEDHAAGGREEKQSVLCENVGVKETSAISNSDFVLSLLVVTVKRREIDVRGCFVNVDIMMRSTEDAKQDELDGDLHREDLMTCLCITRAAQEKNMLERPAGCLINCQRRVR